MERNEILGLTITTIRGQEDLKSDTLAKIECKPRDEHLRVALKVVGEISIEAPLFLKLSASFEVGDATNTQQEYVERPVTVIHSIKSSQGKNEEVERLKIFLSPKEKTIVLKLANEAKTNERLLTFVIDRKFVGVIEMRDLNLINGAATYIRSGDQLAISKSETQKKWYTKENKVLLECFLGTFFLAFPFNMESLVLTNDDKNVLNWFLFDNIEKWFFGKSTNEIPLGLPALPIETKPFPGSGVGLAFSFGEDSTAAASLLSDDVIKFYCKRADEYYYLPNGARVSINPYSFYESNFKKVSNLIVIENNLEKIGLAAGMRHGFGHNFGYVVPGIILSRFLGLRTICFGSVMEQVFLKSGYKYSDISSNESSSFNKNRRILEKIGITFALPTGGCSEVLTSAIVERGPLAGVARSCPNISDDGEPCGKCFKCFRKQRLALRVPSAEISLTPTIRDLLRGRPLKSATSVIYACQQSGEAATLFPEYSDLNLEFLTRFYESGMYGLMPGWLCRDVVSRLKALGFRAMEADDELRLKCLGATLYDPYV
jgi:hypothetical protein